MVTRPAANQDGHLPATDEAAADVTSLLRAFGRRALFLAALALLIGAHMMALVLALAGIGLLVAPVSGTEVELPVARR
ncbi:hypothetical protein ACFYO1_12915 [Nocardia sp. NPDC006044]|uniref:hypothetical protein n=1 Tax=Nocardia sp. NPDC006044 TaxID=3364306 RepID=UPI003680BAA4